MNDSENRNSGSGVTVDIYDQTYQLRAKDPQYIQKLAATVDAKMRAVASHGSTVDSLRVAVLAALNIADELARLQEQCQKQDSTVSETEISLRNRANTLSGLLDSVLEDQRRTG